MMLKRTATAARRSGLEPRLSVTESAPAAVPVPGPRLGDTSSEWRQEEQVGTGDIFEPKIIELKRLIGDVFTITEKALRAY